MGLGIDIRHWPAGVGAGSSATWQKEARRKDLETQLKVQTIHSHSFLWLSNASPNPLHVTLATLQFPIIPVAPPGSGQDTAFHQIRAPHGAPTRRTGDYLEPGSADTLLHIPSQTYFCPLGLMHFRLKDCPYHPSLCPFSHKHPPWAPGRMKI